MRHGWTIVLALVLLAGCGAEPEPVTREAAAPDPFREVIATDRAPGAIGPYSQAIRVGNRLYLSGQIGIDPDTGEMVEGGVKAETRQVLANLRAVLDAAGFEFADVVQSQVFLADLADYADVNRIYAEAFGGSPPARAAVQVARLPRDARVEILMVAVREE